MQKMNKKGHGSYEFLTVAVVVLILSAIVLTVALVSSGKQKFKLFRYNAQLFGINSINYSDTVYLYEMIEDGLVNEIKNNFYGTEFCDDYESKVEFTPGSTKVTLSCGKYLIYKQDVTASLYKIYKVSDWSSEYISGDNVDKKTVYSLYLDDKKALDGYYEEELFIKLVSSKYGSKYDSLKDIKEDFNVKTKKLYRKRVLVDK